MGDLKTIVEKADYIRWCHNCAKDLLPNTYHIRFIPKAAFAESEVILCLNCAIDIGEKGKSVKNH